LPTQALGQRKAACGHTGRRQISAHGSPRVMIPLSASYARVQNHEKAPPPWRHVSNLPNTARAQQDGILLPRERAQQDGILSP
jgi:hypothetical protein